MVSSMPTAARRVGGARRPLSRPEGLLHARKPLQAKAAQSTRGSATSQKSADTSTPRREEFNDTQIPESLPVDFGEGVSAELESAAGQAAGDASSQSTPARAGSDKPADGGAAVSGSVKGIVLLNVGAALFGSNMVVIKEAQEMLSATSLNAFRFLLAAACFAPLLPRAWKERSMVKPALELGFWLTAGYTCQAVGLAMTSATNGAFTGTFTVLAVPFLVALSGRSIKRKTWFAAVTALIGVSLLTTGDGTPPNAGDACCVASAILFGVHKFRSESITGRVHDTIALVALQLAILAAASCLLAVPDAQAYLQSAGVDFTQMWGDLKGLPWDELAFMGIGTTALTLWIEMNSLKEVSAPLAALIYSAEPLWGASLAWIILQERWGAQGWVGAALILGSSLVCQLGGDPAERASVYEDKERTRKLDAVYDE